MLRGFLVDSARCLESREYYHRFSAFLQQRGLNTLLWHFTDDQGCAMRFDSLPGTLPKHSFTRDEMRCFSELSGDNGVQVVPELETLGHSRYITSLPKYAHLNESNECFTSLCPVHPETRALIRFLLREVAESFSSAYLHVGLDEVHFGNHPLTKAALGCCTADDIFHDYTLFVHREVRLLGKRMIMWANFQTLETTWLRRLPRDIILAVWEYTPQVSPQKIQILLDLGFDLILCPALITYEHPFFPGIACFQNVAEMTKHSLRQGQGRVLGIIPTIWTPPRYLQRSLWWPIYHAARMICNEKDLSLVRSAKCYLRDIHGIHSPTAEMASALAELVQLAPPREEWMSLVRNMPFDFSRLDSPDRKSVRYGAAIAGLRQATEVAKRDLNVLKDLELSARLLDYLYRRASGTTKNSAVLPEEGQRLLAELEHAWDETRDASDPLKNSARFEFDEENLIMNFKISLAATESPQKA